MVLAYALLLSIIVLLGIAIYMAGTYYLEIRKASHELYKKNREEGYLGKMRPPLAKISTCPIKTYTKILVAHLLK